jgi:hypothetical protein
MTAKIETAKSLAVMNASQLAVTSVMYIEEHATAALKQDQQQHTSVVRGE